MKYRVSFTYRVSDCYEIEAPDAEAADAIFQERSVADYPTLSYMEGVECEIDWETEPTK